MSVSIRHTVSPTMTEEEQKLLRSIGAVRRYPVCRFELRSSKDRELCSVALDAVHLQERAITRFSTTAPCSISSRSWPRRAANGRTTCLTAPF